MIFTEPEKQDVYAQINKFNSTLIQGGVKIEDARFFVTEQVAKHISRFVNILPLNIANEPNVIDLCFGSGNLTAHVLLDNDINYKNLVLNDLYTQFSNQEIGIGEKTKRDFLNSNNFQDLKADFIIFNPQIGGSRKFPEGELKLTKDLKNEKKVRETINEILNQDGWLLFFGTPTTFETIFVNEDELKLKLYYVLMYGDKFVYLLKNTSESINTKCYELVNDEFVVNTECRKASSNLADLGSLDEVFEGLTKAVKEFHQHSMQNPFGGSYSQEWQNTPTLTMNESPSPEFNSDTKEQSNNLTSDLMQKGSCDFPYKNILLKGVPGTGKSRLLELIIEKRLNLQKADWDHHVLRVNIHSASSNADLMQGIAVSANDGAITYSEKRGLIFDLICRACQYPNQPFVLILEEVQENSLNELIGDLIYLIEDTKRAKLSTISQALSSNDCLGLVEAYVNNLPDVHYVKIPNLVSLGEYRKMIFPANLYIFCTSNYRDDKKIIEDNLLRRFEVIDLYPRPEAIADPFVREFLQKLNSVIVEVLKDEIHPDRFQIGHAIWMDVKNKESFAKALYKTLIELKEIREIQPADVKKVFEKLRNNFTNNNNDQSNKWLYEVLGNLTPDNPVAMIHSLQGMAYQDLMTLINDSKPKVEHLEVLE